ncbi:protein TolQ [Candidatus Electronema sp. JM]|uniref:protein TolQ n=1 Tax=Candidatus Electronema sp. JM TaxID=3401571 RepID=UPI003AA81AAD
MNFSVFSMMAHASLLVKLVMLILLFFSVVSWWIIISKQLLFSRSRKASEEFLADFWESKTLNNAYESAKASTLSPEAAVFVSGFNELRKISAVRGSQVAENQETIQMKLAVMDNLKRAVRKAQLIETERLERSLAFLATTGSATPFIGLFGTVWGILVSFQEIGARGGASLAVVAPGISEALVATAAGLAVAIPAVVFYNFYANKVADFQSDLENFSFDFLNLIERDMLTRK